MIINRGNLAGVLVRFFSVTIILRDQDAPFLRVQSGHLSHKV
jgi:hypothetical protein